MTPQVYDARYETPTLQEAITAIASGINGVHPACDEVPPISARDFDQLVDSVEAHGLLRPIEVNSKGQLVDGRNRLMACAVLGIELGEDHIVVTDADPYAIASSNNARRHLSEDQKIMEAERLLEVERERARKRKADGASKGRASKQNSLGTKPVPSNTPSKKRQPRATDKVAAETGVSRDKLATAERLRKTAPKLAEKVEQGDISLNAAAEQAGVAMKKQTKPKPLRVVVEPTAAVPPPTAIPTGAHTLLEDDLSVVTDLAIGVRKIWTPHGTLLVHKTDPRVGTVLRSGDQWIWCTGSADSTGTVPTRESAEQKVLAYLKRKQ